MKKLYNKALLYQYYHSGKWALLLGSCIFAFFTYFSSNTEIEFLKDRISSLESDVLYVSGNGMMLVELFVLFFVYVVITGKNKRNNLTFLTSGPYSKEEIKKNQIFFLIISLLIMLTIYVYINLCIFYKERTVLSLIEGSFFVLFRDALKLLTCGLAFISYLVLMDALFSNSGITIFLIVFTPIVFIVDTCMVLYMEDFFRSYSFLMGKYGIVIKFLFKDLRSYILQPNITEMLTFKQEIIIMLLILFATGIVFYLAWMINKKLILNNINRFFNFFIVEKIFFWVFSFSVVLLICTIIVSFLEPIYGRDMYFQMQRTLKGTSILFIILSFVVIISTIMQKVIRRLIKKFA